jgi:hypothetical protein
MGRPFEINGSFQPICRDALVSTGYERKWTASQHPGRPLRVKGIVGAHLITVKVEYHLQNMTLSTHVLLALIYYIF